MKSLECSGIHRSLGTHISKVKSLTLDTNSFTKELVDLLAATGNSHANAIWERKLSDFGDLWTKPVPKDKREYKSKYIHAKYVDKLFMQQATDAAYENIS